MMNNQIKALMDQTLDEKFAGTWSTMDMQDLQKFAERFSELIVRECSSFLKDTLDDHFAAEQLEEHFGVEE